MIPALTLDKTGSISLQRQIIDQVRQQIVDGTLHPGTTLVSTRILARRQNVSRNTVVLAYDQLITEGYLETKPSVGTVISPHLGGRSERGSKAAGLIKDNKHFPLAFAGRAPRLAHPQREKLSIDFWIGRPEANALPHRTWRQLLLSNLGASGSNLTEYGNPAGLWRLRKAVADYLGSARGINASPEQIIIVVGIQQALNIIARLLLSNNTPVALEDPCYSGAAYLFESFRANIIPIPVDPSGLATDLLPNRAVALVYTTPSHQYPLGYTLSLPRRLALLHWANRVGAYIVEDDYDSEFRYDGKPLTALKALDKNESVFYLGTFSKVLGAGLRIGYLVAPRGLVREVNTIKALLDNGNAWLEQAVLADFIRSNRYRHHLRRLRKTYLAKRDCLIEALQNHFGDVELSGIEGGMHIAWHLPDHFPSADWIQERAQRHRVGVYTLRSGGAHMTGTQDNRVLLFGYAGLPQADAREGVNRIAAVLKDNQESRSLRSSLSSVAAVTV